MARLRTGRGQEPSGPEHDPSDAKGDIDRAHMWLVRSSTSPHRLFEQRQARRHRWASSHSELGPTSRSEQLRPAGHRGVSSGLQLELGCSRTAGRTAYGADALARPADRASLEFSPGAATRTSRLSHPVKRAGMRSDPPERDCIEPDAVLRCAGDRGPRQAALTSRPFGLPRQSRPARWC